ncbi:hypothetical protein HT576_01425 [Haloterrigena sp. SYSU A121-1]|uniref:Uncharacterized protein n=1 Tax=Haloterrigena gelatinilytica TaxID=2741724 RepID=A0A8J8KDK7_9EURY|nr:hypothetical protein [Haloterrigena gelatinilytica]NUB89696.1 hypothetical protein [Haloterrigena gelatinilytica]
MGRNRRRRSRGGPTRRSFLAGGALIAGGVAIRSDTGAFSQVNAGRLTHLATSDDDSALLGLQRTDAVRPGIDDQHLVDLTNNTDGLLEVSLSLSNPGQGELSDTGFALADGATRSVAVSVDRDSSTGEAALPFEVTASGDAVEITLTRAVTVTDPPVVSEQIRDRTRNGNAAFTISYRVRRLPDFDRIEIEVENLDAGYIGKETYVQTTKEGSVSYPRGGGGDGGADGDTYEFRFRVYDQSGEVTELYTETTTTADGENPPGDDLGSEDDPKLVGFSVTNDEQYTNNRFTVDYEVTRLEEFDEVQVEFDNTERDWADRTKSSDDAPTGTVVYPAEGQRQGGVDGNTYDVTVEVYNQSGIPVDSGTVEIEAGSDETVEWP